MPPEDRTRGVRVLVVEPDRALAGVLCEELRAHGHQADSAETLEKGLLALSEVPFEVAVVDLSLPDGDGLGLGRRAKEDGHWLEILTLADSSAVPAAIEGLWRGAYDYLLKPTRVDELVALVAKAAEHARLRHQVACQTAALDRLDLEAEPVSDDPAMKATLDALARAAASDMPLLLVGDAGAGKAHLARFAHRKSPRGHQPFVAVHCSMAADALEAELFGRGNDNGQAKIGSLATAGGGTLFVASVCDAAPAVQERLAEALASGQYRPAGSARGRRSHVRLLFGSRKDVREEARAGRFHRGLLERLKDGALTIPPLRARTSDIGRLATHFLGRAAPQRQLSAEAHAELLRYPWPGNVRELRLVIERAALLGDGEAVQPQELLLSDSASGWTAAAVRNHLSLAELEMQYILAMLEQNGGHRGRTARELGIDPKTLYNKLGPQRPRRR